jgi:hypothetical protein
MGFGNEDRHSLPVEAYAGRYNTACVDRTDALSKCGKCFLLIKFRLGNAYPNRASATFTGRPREEV